MDASEIFPPRILCERSIDITKGTRIHIPNSRWYSKMSGRDYELREPTSRREQTVRSEDLSGELQGDSGEPRPTESKYDAEARGDFWSMEGDFIYRHHIAPRVQLHVPQKETFLVPLKYIDVTRATYTNLDVLLERRVDDCWNVDANRGLSDSGKGFIKFILLKEKPHQKNCVVRGEIDKKSIDYLRRPRTFPRVVSGQKPRLTKEVMTIMCKTENFVPLAVPGLSATSGSNSSSTSTLQDFSSTSPAEERSDDLVPGRSSGSLPKTQNQNKKRNGNRDSNDRLRYPPEWLEEFTDNLEDTEVSAPVHISQNSDSERPTKVVSRKHRIFSLLERRELRNTQANQNDKGSLEKTHWRRSTTSRKAW